MISVIVSTYNREKNLRLCLTALRQQSFGDFEVIVSDDGSTDGTPSVIQEFDFPRYHYVWHRHNNFGLSKTRNDGAKLSSGEILCFIDADILLVPDALQVANELYQENVSRAVGGYFKYLKDMVITPDDVKNRWDDIWNMRLEVPANPVKQYKPEGYDIREVPRNLPENAAQKDDLFSHEHDVSYTPLCLIGGNMMIPKNVFEDVGGFDESFTTYGGEDAEMSLAIISRGFGISYSRRMAGVHVAHPADPGATTENEMRVRKLLAKRYPWFFNQDGTPNMKHWGKKFL